MCFPQTYPQFLWMNIALVEMIKKITIKLYRGDRIWSTSSPTAIGGLAVI